MNSQISSSNSRSTELLDYTNRMFQTTNVSKEQHAKKVQVGKDQEKAQSEKDSHSKNRGGKKPN